MAMMDVGIDQASIALQVFEGAGKKKTTKKAIFGSPRGPDRRLGWKSSGRWKSDRRSLFTRQEAGNAQLLH